MVQDDHILRTRLLVRTSDYILSQLDYYVESSSLYKLTVMGQPKDRFLTFNKQTEKKTDQLSVNKNRRKNRLDK